METKNLTPVQVKLVDDLIKEFTKINPKPTANGVKRFSFDTIDECQREEERFVASIKKHNQTMIRVFEKQLADELKAFNKEFGKVFITNMGYVYQGQNKTQHGYEEFIETNKNGTPQNDYSSRELYLFIISKTKIFDYGDSRWNYFNGKAYTKLQVDFKREKVSITLDSGKMVSAWKISGLMFCDKEYLHRNGAIITPTLDEFIQTNKELQRRIVELAPKK
jgi:hypothetical protein